MKANFFLKFFSLFYDKRVLYYHILNYKGSYGNIFLQYFIGGKILLLLKIIHIKLLNHFKEWWHDVQIFKIQQDTMESKSHLPIGTPVTWKARWKYSFDKELNCHIKTYAREILNSVYVATKMLVTYKWIPQHITLVNIQSWRPASIGRTLLVSLLEKIKKRLVVELWLLLCNKPTRQDFQYYFRLKWNISWIFHNFQIMYCCLWF